MKEEMSSNIEFGGTEAKQTVNFAELKELIGMFDGGTPVLHHIGYHCDIEKTALIAALQVKVEDLGPTASYFGIPVYEKKFIPLNEVWLQDKNGKIIQKFKV